METYSKGAGNAGNIQAISTDGSINSENIATYSNNANAGKVTLKAGNEITVGDIFARAAAEVGSAFNGGNVTFVAANGKIKSGNITTISCTGNAGKVDLEASGDVEIGAVASNVLAGSGKGGNISVTSSSGNITAYYLRSDSVNGTGGNIKLDANKLIKIQGSISIDDLDYSIYASGYTKGNSIKIKHGGGATDNPFVVSALSGVGAIMPFTNGVVANISSATSGIFSLENPLSYPSTHILGDISITTNYTGNSPQANVPIGDVIGFESLYSDKDRFFNTRIPSPTLIASTDISSGLTVPITSIIIPEGWNPGNQPIKYYIGNSAHNKIALNYRSFHLPKDGYVVFTNSTPVKSILNRVEVPIPASLKNIQLDKRPDILDFTQKFIYEIKPRGQEAEAVRISKNFIKIFKKANIDLTLGPVNEIGTSNILPFPGGILAFASSTPGAIIYRSYRRQDKTEVDENKITRSNILEAIGRPKDGFPDDIFTPVPTSVNPIPELPSIPPTPYLDPSVLPLILYKFLEYIFKGSPIA